MSYRTGQDRTPQRPDREAKRGGGRPPAWPGWEGGDGVDGVEAPPARPCGGGGGTPLDRPRGERRTYARARAFFRPAPWSPPRGRIGKEGGASESLPSAALDRLPGRKFPPSEWENGFPVPAPAARAIRNWTRPGSSWHKRLTPAPSFRRSTRARVDATRISGVFIQKHPGHPPPCRAYLVCSSRYAPGVSGAGDGNRTRDGGINSPRLHH